MSLESKTFINLQWYIPSGTNQSDQYNENLKQQYYQLRLQQI